MTSNTSPEIDSQLKQALGSKSPSDAWAEIVGAVQEFSLKNPGEWDSLATNYQDEPYLVIEMLEKSDPVKMLEVFHELNPQVDLQNLQNESNEYLTEAALDVMAEVIY